MLKKIQESLFDLTRHLFNLYYMEITTGCDWHWKGKPWFGFYYMYYDGDHYVFHFGPYWIEWDYNYD